MADGYGAGLFDSSGPKEFADAVGQISSKLTGVQTSFGTFGTQAQGSLQGISKAVDDLTAKLGQLQNAVGGLNLGGGGGMGQPAAAPPSGNTGSPTPQWDMANVSQPTGGPTVQSPGPLAGMPQNTASVTQQFPSQQQGSASIGQRAVQSMVPAAVGAAGTYAKGMMATAIQGQSIGQMYGPLFGQSARSLYVQPPGIMSQNAQDFAQSNLYAIQNLGLAPGTKNWSSVMGAGGSVQQLMGLEPGLTMQQGTQQAGGMYSPQTLNRELALGFDFSPAGRRVPAQQQYQQVFQRLTRGQKVNPSEIQDFMRPGGPGDALMQAIGWSGTGAEQGFQNYALEQAGFKGKLPNMGTAAGIKQTTIGGTAGFSQLQRQSSQSRLEQQAEPALAQTSKDLNDAATKLLNATNGLASVLGGGGGGGGWGGAASTAATLGGTYIAGKVATKVGGRVLGRVAPNLAGRVASMKSNVLGKAKGLLTRGGAQAGEEVVGEAAAGAGETAALGGGELAAAGGLEAAGAGFDATGIGLPIGLGLGALGLGIGAFGFRRQIGHAASSAVHGIGHAASSLWHGIFGGGGSTAGAAEPKRGSADQNVSDLLSSKPPRHSLIDCLTSEVHKSDKTLAAALIYGEADALGAPPGGTGGGALGAGGVGGVGPGSAGSGGTAGPYKYKGNTTFATNAAGLFKGSSTNSGSSGGTGSSSSTGSPPSAVAPSGGALTDAQIQQLWISVGGPANVAKTMSGIAQAESGREPGNVQQGQPPGLTGWGLWQITPTSGINQNGKFGNLLDATNNAKAALYLYQSAGNTLQPWSGDHYLTGNNIDPHSSGASYARGSQLIARTQLALLHRGEAVVPAADNYSSSPYNRGGAASGSGGSITLNFTAGSVVLQVPASSSQQDMENLANQFVQAISKPAIIAGVRSQ